MKPVLALKCGALPVSATVDSRLLRKFAKEGEHARATPESEWVLLTGEGLQG